MYTSQNEQKKRAVDLMGKVDEIHEPEQAIKFEYQFTIQLKKIDIYILAGGDGFTLCAHGQTHTHTH